MSSLYCYSVFSLDFCADMTASTFDRLTCSRRSSLKVFKFSFSRLNSCTLDRSVEFCEDSADIFSTVSAFRAFSVYSASFIRILTTFFLLRMGNSYIDSDIRPLITELAQRRKYVVIATHNANIAVRTLPYMSIFRTHENGEYKTYIGNPFDDRLVNIENQTDVKSWTEESMHSLEGGSEA